MRFDCKYVYWGLVRELMLQGKSHGHPQLTQAQSKDRERTGDEGAEVSMVSTVSTVTVREGFDDQDREH